jgi:hypothetical protein
MVGAGKRFVENAEMPPQSAGAIYVKWSSDPLGYIGQRNLFREQLIVFVLEVIHGVVRKLTAAAEAMTVNVGFTTAGLGE